MVIDIDWSSFDLISHKVIHFESIGFESIGEDVHYFQPFGDGFLLVNEGVSVWMKV